MARQRKATLVDGYTALKAAQQAVESARGRSAPKQQNESPPDSRPAPPRGGTPASHIGHTAMPTRRAVLCHQCNYAFQVTGRVPNTLCPKCKTDLDLSDHMLEGEIRLSLHTAGTITIHQDATLLDGILFARDIVLNGQMKGGRIEAYQVLEIGPKACLIESDLSAKNLRIAAEAACHFKKGQSFEQIEVFGILNGQVEARTLIHIHAGGLFQGQLKTQHLLVDDGGGLCADVNG